MPDRLRYITWNDTVTPANSSGANGFTRPSLFGQTVGSGTQWPVGVSRATAVKWLWRVKQWTATSSLVNFNTGVLSDTGTPPTSELELVTRASRLAYGWERINADCTIQWNIADACADDGAGLIYPLMNLFQISVSNGANGIIFDVIDPGTATGVQVCTLDGVDFDMYYTITGTYTVQPIAFTASAFWPYAAADASPIYNTTTGAQLQSPLN